MTKEEWLKGIEPDAAEQVFRIARGCQNCAFFLPVDGQYRCIRPDLEKVCREEHEVWLKGDMEC